ncbi:MAG: hypothetical protein PHH24_02135 [Candidatus Moranbacteria bacterium]|jgi:hypothetical protein|nr:hypothetical protein [Candidatus Moranbacteria bacterium]MDD5652148.1 hypothetical protein [Candidatus Moranbacteria bacterium]MDX9855962.1 hypothetical protein [Candidatus Moranbacteria bacterium]
MGREEVLIILELSPVFQELDEKYREDAIVYFRDAVESAEKKLKDLPN